MSKLSELQQEYTDKLKRLKLLDAGVDYTDIDVYAKYLKSDTAEELENEVELLVADIKQQNTAQDGYGDPGDHSVWRPFN